MNVSESIWNELACWFGVSFKALVLEMFQARFCEEILLGNIVRHRRSGYAGMVITRRIYFAPYSVYFRVDPQPVDGCIVGLSVYIEESRLEVITKGTGLAGPRVCESGGSVSE